MRPLPSSDVYRDSPALGQLMRKEAPMGLDWGVQLARLSLFLGEPYAISDKDWAFITGQDEAETRQLVPGGRRLSGSVPNGVMHMSAMASRFDVILGAAESGQEQEVQLPSVGPYEETFKSFFESTCKWIKEVKPAVKRIAFGAVLTCEVANREEAYDRLRDLLKSLTVDPTNMRDLLYRVNWPGKSEVEPGLLLNRVTTWSSLRITRTFLQINQTAIEGGKARGIDAVHLDMDHNTDEARQASFDGEKVIPIYSELIELACQNAAEGEVPCP